jgi:broad specificity phosphatase PhoE
MSSAPTTVHLVRHGEVFNPDGVLYGRLPGFHLSDRGLAMAEMVSEHLAGRDIAVVTSSPLERAQQTAAAIARPHDLTVGTDDDLIEAGNYFQGLAFGVGDGSLRHPRHWPRLVNPFRPSWGEPYVSIAARMLDMIEFAWNATDSGEVALVSHQLPIWMAHRRLAGERLFHDPRRRRCTLSSITTVARSGNTFAEVDYQDPAAALQASAIDLGAV